MITWLSAIGLILFARGVSFVDSLISLAVISIQLPLGVLVWLKCNAHRQHDWPSVIGASLGIGSVVVVMVDQLLVNVLSLSRVGAILPGLVALPFAFAEVKRTEIGRTSPDDVSHILAAVASALMLFGWAGADSTMVYSALVLTLTAGLIVYLASRRQPLSVRFSMILACIALVVVVAIVQTYQLVPDTFPRLLRDLSLASDDQVKSEQLSYSLGTRGLFSNSAAIELPIKFHWMSLAWVGAMSTASAAEPFVYTLHVAPLVATTALGFLATHIVRRSSSNRWLAVAAPFIVTVTANPDGTIRSVFAVTSSNVIPHLWIGLLFVVILQLNEFGNDRSFSWRIALVMILPAVVMLGKGPYGVTIGAGIVFALVLMLIAPRYRNRRTLLGLALIGATALQIVVYLAFLRSDLTDRFDLGIVWSRFPYPLPFRYSTSPGLVEIAIGSAIVLGFLALRMGPLFVNGLKKLPQFPSSFALGCSAGGMISFLVYQSDGTVLGSETYFINAAVTVIALFGLTTTASSRAVFRSAAGAIVSSVGFLLVFLVTGLRGTTIGFFLVGCFLAVLGAGATVPLRGSGERLAVVGLTLLFASTVYGVVNLPWNSENRGASNIVASSAELQVFDWIRQRTPKDAVFMTNRELCVDVTTCGFSGMPTAAAFTQRAFVIEGLRTLTPAVVWNEQIPDRLKPFVAETHAYAEWALGRRSRPERVSKADWILLVSDTQIPSIRRQGFQEKHRSADGRIHVLEVIP